MTGKSAYEPIRKEHHRWLYYSLAVSLAWTSLFVFEVVMFSVAIRGFPIPLRIAAIVIPLVVLVSVALIFLMGYKIVPWRYGVFGPYECRPRPKDFRPRICINEAPRRPQHATRYEVGEEGIELTFIFGSRAFLPAASITAIGPASWSTYVVEHDSPEIGSPLVVSQKVGEALLVGLGRAESKT